MPCIEHSVKRIAIKQLTVALRLYLEVTDKDVEGYYAVVTLAGASEEILGKLLNELGVENAWEREKKDWAIINGAFSDDDLPDKTYGRLNFMRNSLKHWSPGDPKVIVANVEDEAKQMLQRALKNHSKLVDNCPLDKELRDDVEFSELQGRFQYESHGVGGYS